MLRTILLFFLINILSCVSFSQTSKDIESKFDFWVGHWNVSWTNQDGSISTGTNKISKILDDKIILENFEIQSTGFKGTSISVYNPKDSLWHQAWADNTGNYFNFIGEFDGENRVFKTLMTERDGKQIIWRMIFTDIDENTFNWDWQLSEDHGNHWKSMWKLKYERAQ